MSRENPYTCNTGSQIGRHKIISTKFRLKSSVILNPMSVIVNKTLNHNRFLSVT